MDRSEAQAEAHFIYRLQTVGGFGGKSDQLNTYNVFRNDPGFFTQDLARYRNATPESVRAAAERHLRFDARVTLSVVPRGHTSMALAGSSPVSVS
jgi:zinc protease